MPQHAAILLSLSTVATAYMLPAVRLCRRSLALVSPFKACECSCEHMPVSCSANSTEPYGVANSWAVLRAQCACVGRYSLPDELLQGLG
jgi:hypothetical protein